MWMFCLPSSDLSFAASFPSHPSTFLPLICVSLPAPFLGFLFASLSPSFLRFFSFSRSFLPTSLAGYFNKPSQAKPFIILRDADWKLVRCLLTPSARRFCHILQLSALQSLWSTLHSLNHLQTSHFRTEAWGAYRGLGFRVQGLGFKV